MTIPIEQQLGQTLMLLTIDFQQRLDTDLQQRGIAGVGKRHRDVFLYLGKFGPSRSVDIAQAAGIRPQSMMKIVHELEQRGLILRQPDPADSRAKLISFTAAGQVLITEMAKSTSEVWHQYSAMIGQQQLASTVRNLQTLLEGK